MARPKKEPKEDPVVDEIEAESTAGLDGAVPQAEPGLEAEQAEGSGMTDWELSQLAAQEEDQVGQGVEAYGEPPPETGIETDMVPEPGPADGQELQADAFVPDDEPAGYLGLETPVSQAPETGPSDDQPAEPEPANDQPMGSASEKPAAQKLRMPGRRGPRVVSIDAERTVETEHDKLRNDLLDLVESMKGKKILTGTIQGVERLAANPEMCYAVIYHGDIKVIIPVLEAIEEPTDYRNQPRGDVLHYLLNKRLGAEVDYIVTHIDQECEVVSASRLAAMALKRREYYFRTDREGNYQIYEGIRAEARVVSVIRAGIFVDLFGVECYIPLRELSYQRWMDATSHYQSGQRVLVKVLEVDRTDRNKPLVTASVKQAGENPYEVALKKYTVNNLYVGTVSMVDLTGVFVSLDGGIDCLCSHPKRGRPPRGARVTVRILGINRENNRIWGVITHMSSVR